MNRIQSQHGNVYNLRQALKKELGGKCSRCKSTMGLEFDCILPAGAEHHGLGSAARIRFYRGEHAKGNLQLLCARCHNVKTQNERAGRKRAEAERAWRNHQNTEESEFRWKQKLQALKDEVGWEEDPLPSGAGRVGERPVITACVQCGENAPETGLTCDECREDEMNTPVESQFRWKQKQQPLKDEVGWEEDPQKAEAGTMPDDVVEAAKALWPDLTALGTNPSDSECPLT